ncbi:MAG: tetrahydromethanopterin S-methyltransferase subunit H [Promethearchaeota archaeon]
MFKFEKEQKIFDIAGVKVGGQPGEYPTVLIGSIFYDRHKIVTNVMKGEFDKRKAESLLKKQEEMSDKTGNSVIIDVVGSSVEALNRYVDFVSTITESPFLVDGPSAAVRIPVMRHLAETGLIKRAIYNSIDYAVEPDEIASLKEIGVESSVLMAFNPRNVWAEGRMEILEGYEGQKGLLEAANEGGIHNILVDTAVLDVPSIGISARAVYIIKSEYGFPVGCGPPNAITTWKKAKKEMGPYAYNTCLAGSGIITQSLGANFVLYGPIEEAEAVFPACAMADAIIAYNARRLGIRQKTKNHPLLKIF